MNKRDRKKIDALVPAVKDGDLYDALHRVGDDPIKDNIESDLKEVLDPETFKLVVAVFKFNVSFTI